MIDRMDLNTVKFKFKFWRCHLYTIYIALIKSAVLSVFTYLKVETILPILQMKCTKKKKSNL